MTTITQERAGLVKVGRPLINREKWGARFTRYAETRTVSEPAPLVFVHITITNPKNYSSDEAHMRAVEAIGISRFPNTGISYNRGLFQSGNAMEGQPVGRRGAHTVNDKNITRCVSAGCPHKGGAIPSAATNLNTVVRAYAICQNINDPVTDAQLDSLARTIAADMLAGFVRRDAQIHGHRCVAWKDCPAAKMWARMAELRRLVSHYVSTGLTTPKPPITPAIPEDNMTDYTPADLKEYAGVGVHGQMLGRSGVTIGQAIDSTRKDAAASRAMLATLNIQVTSLSAAVQTLAQNQGIDPDAIIAAVKAAADDALADLKITLAVEDDDPTPEA